MGNPVTESQSEVELFKVMPHVTLNDINKLSMLRTFGKRSLYLNISFRSWDLYVSSVTEYDQAFVGHSKRRLSLRSFDILSLQTDRKNIMSRDISVFDDCNLSNKLYLSSAFYPYDDLNLDFGKKKYAVLFDMFS